MEVRFLPPEPDGDRPDGRRWSGPRAGLALVGDASMYQDPCGPGDERVAAPRSRSVCHRRPHPGTWRSLRPWTRGWPRTRRTSRSLAAVVLAAGKGKRLKSSTPKVLHPICGRPALWHVLQGGLAARPNKIVVVVGPRRRRRARRRCARGASRRRRSSSSRPSSSAPAHAVLAARAGGRPRARRARGRRRLRPGHRRRREAARARAPPHAARAPRSSSPSSTSRAATAAWCASGAGWSRSWRASTRRRRSARSSEVSTVCMVFRRTDLFRALPRRRTARTASASTT